MINNFNLTNESMFNITPFISFGISSLYSHIFIWYCLGTRDLIVSFVGKWCSIIVRHWWKCKPISKNRRQSFIGIFAFKKTVLNLDFACNSDNFKVMKWRRGVMIKLFQIDNSKCLFLENVETVNCNDVLSPYDASILMWDPNNA